jgi:hypothetical protein
MNFLIKNLKRTAKEISCDLYFVEIGLTIFGMRCSKSESLWHCTSFSNSLHATWSFDYKFQKEVQEEVIKRTEQFAPPEFI